MVDIMTFQEDYLTGFSFLLDQKFTDFTVLILSLKVEIQDSSEQRALTLLLSYLYC